MIVIKTSITVNSYGEVQPALNGNAIKLKNEHTRKQELNEITNLIIDRLASIGTSATTDSFAYIIQPFFINDKIVMFVKIRIEPDNELVRQKFLKGAIKDVLSESVFCLKENERPVWYILYALETRFERNLCDCCFQKVTIGQLTPYKQYMEEVEKSLMPDAMYKSKKMSKGYRILIERFDRERALKSAAILGSAQLENILKDSIADICKVIGLDKKYPFANSVFYCLNYINDNNFSGQVYPVYTKLKEMIKSVQPTAHTIRYSGTVISYTLSGRVYKIYLCDGSNDDIVYVFNGNVINDEKELSEQVSKKVIKQWYETRVVPFITRK